MTSEKPDVVKTRSPISSLAIVLTAPDSIRTVALAGKHAESSPSGETDGSSSTVMAEPEPESEPESEPGPEAAPGESSGTGEDPTAAGVFEEIEGLAVKEVDGTGPAATVVAGEGVATGLATGAVDGEAPEGAALEDDVGRLEEAGGAAGEAAGLDEGVGSGR